MNKKGYNRTVCLEPLILEKEEIDNTRWETYCELFGTDKEACSRIRVNIDSVECWND